MNNRINCSEIAVFGVVGGILNTSFEIGIPKQYLNPWINDLWFHVLAALLAVFVAGRVRRMVFDAYERWQTDKLPSRGRFLILLFMPNDTGDALLGDLEERFYRIVRDPELGLSYARFWYWFQVLVSLRPLVWPCVKRLTGLAALYEAIRRGVR